MNEKMKFEMKLLNWLKERLDAETKLKKRYSSDWASDGSSESIAQNYIVSFLKMLVKEQEEKIK